MKLIIGGAYQGKLEYAQKNCCVKKSWIDGRTCRAEELADCGGIHHFHELVKRMLQEPEDSERTGYRAEETQTTEVSLDGKNSRRQFLLCCRDLCSAEEQAEAFAAWLTACNPEIVIVSNELGYGVVPMEKADRMWRETVGRICTCLAARADEVVRVVCGIGVRIK